MAYFKSLPKQELSNDDLNEIINPIPVDSGNLDFTTDPNNRIVFYNNYPLFITAGSLGIYINSDTGADDIEAGYGFSASKPFKTLSYGFSMIPSMSVTRKSANSSHYSGNVNIYLTGTFSSETLDTSSFTLYELYQRIYIQPATSGDSVTFKNIIINVGNCNYILFQNGTFNFEYTITESEAAISGISVMDGLIIFGTTSTLNLTANEQLRDYLKTNNRILRGLHAYRGGEIIVETSNCNISYFRQAALSNMLGKMYIEKLTGTNLDTSVSSIYAQHGGIISYNTTNSLTTGTSTGGRIYTGVQS